MVYGGGRRHIFVGVVEAYPHRWWWAYARRYVHGICDIAKGEIDCWKYIPIVGMNYSVDLRVKKV